MNESVGKMLLVEKKDYVGILTLNYPEKRNALSPEMLMNICETLEAFSKFYLDYLTKQKSGGEVKNNSNDAGSQKEAAND